MRSIDLVKLATYAAALAWAIGCWAALLFGATKLAAALGLV
jgi:hypothetical protein